MNDSQASNATLSEHVGVRIEQPESALQAAETQPDGSGAVARHSRWTAGRIAALVIGGLQVLVALALLGGGGTAFWYDRTQRDGGYVTTSVHKFSTSGSALATESTDLGGAGWEWLYSPAVLNKVRIRVTPSDASSTLFVGIGPSADVDRYLAGVRYTLITDFWGEKAETKDGGAAAAAPSAQGFWVASDTGTGTRNLVWEPTDGSWTVVVMNADGRLGVDVGADLGARLPALPWIALGLLVGGSVFVVGGALLIGGAYRRYRADRSSTV